MSDFVAPTRRRSSWSKHHSPSGHEYYYDEDRQSSQWERPPDYVSDEETPCDAQYEAGAVESAVPFAASETAAATGGIDPELATATTTMDPANEAMLNEILHFEYNPNVGLYYELERLTLFAPPSVAERSVFSGQWCGITCKKLEVLQLCLQNFGTEEEWQYVLEYEGCALLLYLLSFVTRSTLPIFKDAAAKCIAYCYMVYPNLWTTFLHYHEEHATSLIAVFSVAVSRVTALANTPPEALSQQGVYLGFDIRDIAEFNLNTDDYVEQLAAHVANEAKELVDDTHVTMSTWLIIFTHLFGVEQKPISGLVRSHRMRSLGLKKSDDTLDATCVQQLKDATRNLIAISGALREDVYLLAIKVIAAINMQFPSKDLVGSSEVAELCAELQFGEHVTDAHPVNISEGLMHILNEHVSPEAKMALKLCCDMVAAPNVDGYFYTNDLKILVDMVIRELGNIPLPSHVEDEEESDDHFDETYVSSSLEGDIRNMYVKLALELVSKSSWPTIDDFYRKSDFEDVLRMLLNSTCEKPTKKLIRSLIEGYL